jgi:phosphoribosylglycinamide formyltransferase 2
LTPEAPGIDLDVRIFNKPVTRPYRRMGVALALAPDGDTDSARAAARAAAAKVRLTY